ncbi:MAG: methylmalonyl Co-A mutase-associated GTPase MeaB [Bacteroidota bacterium]
MPRKPKQQASALKVLPGVAQPSQLNDEAVIRMQGKKNEPLNIDDLFNGIRSGNRMLLSKAITLAESARSDHQLMAQALIEKCLPFSGKSLRIGITGVPGVGKSTFIEALGTWLTSRGHKLAVLAIDPSSSRSKGSILGDKTRMEDLATDPNAFIRPSPSAGTLGGVARKTWETVVLCEAAGFNTIFIETVGVGQSETAVHSMVDFFLLMMLAGAGDELQGIKRGIMEMADGIVINKADGSNLKKAMLARSEYERALNLFPLPPSGLRPKVALCSAIDRSGIKEAWKKIEDYCSFTRMNGYFESKRLEQAEVRMYDTIEGRLRNDFFNDKDIKNMLQKVLLDIREHRISSYIAAQQLLDEYYALNGKK